MMMTVECRFHNRRCVSLAMCSTVLIMGTCSSALLALFLIGHASTIGTRSLRAPLNVDSLTATQRVHHPTTTAQNQMPSLPSLDTLKIANNTAGDKVDQNVEQQQQQHGTAAVAKRKSIPRFIFGHSTGHAGSTAVHQALARSDCPWGKPVAKFELIYKSKTEIPMMETQWPFDSDCELTRTRLLPFLNQQFTSDEDEHQTFIDLGHIHNRGRVMECLADLLRDDVAFVKIRRNRYDIAHSFASHFNHSCIHPDSERPHPAVALCPRSSEVESGAGPVNLPVVDEVWDSFTPLQRFLWYADEVEHRWHTLRQRAYPDASRPLFFEVTWSDPGELGLGFENLAKDLGCASGRGMENAKKHVQHKDGTRNCTSFIQQDLDYRRLMKYNDSTLQILLKHPQHVDSTECMETHEELAAAIQLYSDDDDSLSQWVLPASEAPEVEVEEKKNRWE